MVMVGCEGAGLWGWPFLFSGVGPVGGGVGFGVVEGPGDVGGGVEGFGEVFGGVGAVGVEGDADAFGELEGDGDVDGGVVEEVDLVAEALFLPGGVLDELGLVAFEPLDEGDEDGGGVLGVVEEGEAEGGALMMTDL